MTHAVTDDHTAGRPTDSPAPAVPANLPNRSLEMQLLHEDMARAHMAHQRAESAHAVRTLRMAAAVRAHRRAERATVRARRLVMLAVVR